MGEFLSTPIKDKQSEDGENSIVKHHIKPLYNHHIVTFWVLFNARMEETYGRRSLCIIRSGSKQGH
jgi:hypothetical protein